MLIMIDVRNSYAMMGAITSLTTFQNGRRVLGLNITQVASLSLARPLL